MVMVKVKDILQTSRAVLMLEAACKNYCVFEEQLVRICKNSALYRKTKMFFSRITGIFQYSFLGKITESMGKGDLREAFENSGFIKCLFNIYDDCRKRATGYLKEGLAVKHAVVLKNELYIFPVKTGSIVIVTAILCDLFFFALFKNPIYGEIGLLGWIIKGLLLFAGLAGLFCEARLEELEKSSLFVKWIKR